MTKYHNRGRIIYTNGVEFVGQFCEGRKHGVGKFRFKFFLGCLKKGLFLAARSGIQSK